MNAPGAPKAGEGARIVSRDSVLERIDFLRIDASRRLDADRRSEHGQFLTPPAVSRFMASLFRTWPDSLRLLDAGAGVGSLSAAAIAEALARGPKPKRIHVTAFETDPMLLEYLREALDLCGLLCDSEGVEFSADIRDEDFVRAGVLALQDHALFPVNRRSFHAAILNPPYRKLNSDSETRELLRTVGIETSNLYAAFAWLSVRLLGEDGEMVAITPRSFCNGPYFRPFRKALLELANFRQVHIFEARDRAFSDDDVLQENVIFHVQKGLPPSLRVTITSSESPEDADVTLREVEYDEFVRPGDLDSFIHIVPDEIGAGVRVAIEQLDASLADIGLSVSTGRVVDFRARQLLRDEPGLDTAPLIYPASLSDGFVSWPSNKGKKPKALALRAESEELLVPAGYYVLVKRFSSKEECRRVVAAVFDPSRVRCEQIGFENHLNYYHQGGEGVPPALAKGLAVFLNSTLVDHYFRQFSGHTQVNATDLRSFRYPSREKLAALGENIGETFPEQEELDRLVREQLMAKAAHPSGVDPTRAKKMIAAARAVLKALNVPKGQQNDRSALTLLALLGLKPGVPWSKASEPLLGITEMMDYFRDHFGVRYAPNSRETVRRFTVHQFVQMGLVLQNPDAPGGRPVNSPDNRYQIEASALKLIRTFGTGEWEKALPTYLATVENLKRLHATEREMKLIPVQLPDGGKITLTSGGQNILLKEIVEKFCPRFTRGGRVLYLGDAGDKYLHFAERELADLGVAVDRHGKMPDVVVYYVEKDWLVLIEAVTSHGPVSLKRHNELKELFAGARLGLVFVTAFLDRKAMVKHLDEIAWETEVWVAESPTHLIHFNGERFLGPYNV